MDNTLSHIEATQKIQRLLEGLRSLLEKEGLNYYEVCYPVISMRSKGSQYFIRLAVDIKVKDA